MLLIAARYGAERDPRDRMGHDQVTLPLIQHYRAVREHLRGCSRFLLRNPRPMCG
jgi:hypothetical protein